MAVISVETTIGAAIAAASAGDVVVVPPGVYNETVTVDKPITLEGEGGAILDGGWKGEKLNKTFGALIAIKAEGATVRGLRGQNGRGPGIAISESNVTVQDCHVFNTYRHGVLINGSNGKELSNVLVERSSAIRVCQGMSVDRSTEAVGGTCTIVRLKDSVIRASVFGDSYKEGFNVDRGSSNVLITGCVMFNTNHGACYFNCSQDNVVDGNIFFHTLDERYRNQKNGNFPSAVVIGDERGSTKSFPFQRGNRFTNNLIIHYGRFVEVRNNNKTTNGGYNTALDGNVIAANTFVAGPETTEGINIAANAFGRVHSNSVVRDNVFDFTAAKPTAFISKGGEGGILFKNNAWTVAPVARMQGAGDVVGDLKLTNPTATPAYDRESGDYAFVLGNYCPTQDSPLIGAGSDGGVIGALEPLPVEPPPPEPEPNPNAWIAERLSAIWGRLEEVGLEVGALADEVDALAAEIEK